MLVFDVEVRVEQSSTSGGGMHYCSCSSVVLFFLSIVVVISIDLTCSSNNIDLILPLQECGEGVDCGHRADGAWDGVGADRKALRL